jgi:Tat protein secretion system quality control protein TatD with DNase activity
MSSASGLGSAGGSLQTADGLRNALRAVALDSLILETDLTPHRGKRNEPPFIIPAIGQVARVSERDPRMSTQ